AQRYRRESLLSEEEYRDVESKIKKLIELLDSCPKTKKWMKRAKQGEKKKYWRDVEELYR
ncbi:MAG: hypothetical protein DRN64_01545, partial [Thaumarchaeota archaeon]